MALRPPLPAEPLFGEPLPATRRSDETLELLALRRSTPVAMLGEPGPSPADVDDMLRLAMRVPDHRKLEPWRILVIEGEARKKLGDLFAAALKAGEANAAEARIAEARMGPMRAPLIVTVIASPIDDPKKTPQWEQELSSGALCQNLLVAASAMGWATAWVTEWPAYDAHVAKALALGPRERIVGFIYIGTAKAEPVERARPNLAKKVERWKGA